MSANVALIVPVYGDLASVKACLESVFRARCDAAYDLFVIYDAGPEAELEAYLDELQESSAIRLYKNSENLGFPQTINRGFELAGNSNCVILNSDTLVPDAWLDRLVAIAAQDPLIATITPFTNNGEICSFPNFCENNALPQAYDYQQLDELFRQSLPADAIDAPTGVGFCMYVSRASLDAVGQFDALRFERGYGEENDYCMRASAAGFRNVICTNLFVYHAGGKSFGDQKSALVESALAVMRELHPGYDALVAGFIASDPLMPYRLKAVLSLLNQCSEPVILVISHGMGGGADQYISHLKGFYAARAHFILLEPGDHGDCIFSFPQWLNDFQLRFKLEGEIELAYSLIRSIRPRLTLVNHIKGLEHHVQGFIEAADCQYILLLHDYYLISANPTLSDAEGRFSPQRMKESALLEQDVRKGSGFTWPQWSELTRGLVSNALFAIAPSKSARDVFLEFFPDAKIQARYHLDSELAGAFPPVQVSAPADDEPVRVAILGALSKAKGADVVDQVARMAQAKGLSLEFHLIGYAYRPLGKHLTSHGAYPAAQLGDRLDRLHPGFVWFPNLWPETYSYTLSTVMEKGLPAMVTDIGALAERTTGRPFTPVVSHKTSPEAWLEAISSFASELRQHPDSVWQWQDQSRVDPFYSQDFLQIVNSLPRSSEAVVKLSLADLRLILKNQPAGKSGFKALLLRILIWLRTNPRLAWIAGMIPYGLQRGLKRKLSRKPVHRH